MKWDSEGASAAHIGLARRINSLSASELHEFVQKRLHERELHRIVHQLNEAVLSKNSASSSIARTALNRLGFAD
ncbi:hypothetical protein [Pseudoruegeria sp. HB172150]|uniref:hypothetical protein n=1 Tax=Pseudoruegeria sp. HB172150 TaxID=2721164 RepID=UPI0015552FB9|nr:hypothetical protein [Pseudoruegeria sp. HB172150]